MEIPAGPLRDTLEEWAGEQSASPVDRKQRELTERILVPAQEMIEGELRYMRRRYDERMKKVFKEVMREWPKEWVGDPSLKHPSLYPIGYCDQITDYVLTQIYILMGDPIVPGMSTLGQFVKKGGVLRKIHGIQHGKYFQNGIQAGGLWIDVAGDTMDTTQPPVEICSMEASGFKNLDDFTTSGEVSESYWQCNVYPNDIFPFLAPFLPFVEVSKNGFVQMGHTTRGTFATNALADFRPAEDFIFKSRFSDRKLPPEIHKLIGRRFSWDEDTYDFDCGEPHSDVFCRGGAPKGLIADIFERLRNMDPQHLPRLLENADAMAQKFDNLELQV